METLVLPNQYVELQEDEMMYLDGGGVPTWLVSFTIDALLLATPTGAIFAPLKLMGRNAATAFVKKMAPNIAGIAGWALKVATGGFINLSTSTMVRLIIGHAASFTSVGAMIAFIGDHADGNLNGWVFG